MHLFMDVLVQLHTRLQNWISQKYVMDLLLPILETEPDTGLPQNLWDKEVPTL